MRLYSWNLQFQNYVLVIKSKLKCNFSRVWLSWLYCHKTSFDFSICRFRTYPMNVITEKLRAHYIIYLYLYYNIWSYLPNINTNVVKRNLVLISHSLVVLMNYNITVQLHKVKRGRTTDTYIGHKWRKNTTPTYIGEHLFIVFFTILYFQSTLSMICILFTFHCIIFRFSFCERLFIN